MKEKNKMLTLIIIISGFFGFAYEFIFYYINGGMKEFYYRGANFLPWIDIYAIGSLLILTFAYKYKDKPFKVFILSSLICGVLEYVAGLLIYILRDGYRAWNYNTEILSYGSIGGFICIRSVLIFGLSGLFLVYVVIPLVKKMIKNKKLMKISYILLTIILMDEAYNLTIARFTSLPRSRDVYKQLGFNFVNSNK